METLSKKEGDKKHPYVIEYIKGNKLDVVINVPEGTKRDEEVTIGCVAAGSSRSSKMDGWMGCLSRRPPVCRACFVLALLGLAVLVSLNSTPIPPPTKPGTRCGARRWTSACPW